MIRPDRLNRLPCVKLLSLYMLTTLLVGSSAEAANRFVGALADGRTIEGKQIFDWHTADSNPRLDNQRLLDNGNPLLWLRDREAPQGTPPPAFVELVNGDRLPGTVTEYRSGKEQSDLSLPPHLLVAPGFEQRPAQAEEPGRPVLVDIRFVRRIVWQSRERESYQPNQLVLRDGSIIRYRALRLQSSGMTLLTDGGPRRFSFGEAAELHFPITEGWEAHFNELAPLTTGEQAHLMQIETHEGLIATSSLARLIVLGHGGSGKYDQWVHALQPAWSLRPLWVPCRDVVVRRFFAMNEFPLCRQWPQDSTHGWTAGTQGAVNRNANVLGGMLRTGDYEAGWGFGVQGAGEIVFPLHRSVRLLRGRVGLDPMVADGGCIRGQVLLGHNSQSPVWQSPHIMGSRHAVSLGTIGIDPLDSTGQPRSLRLAIDPAHHGRPAGADPWEIRDVANWLDPHLVLDEGLVREELRRRSPSQVPAFDGWQVVQEEGISLQATDYFSSLQGPMGEYRTLIQTSKEQPLRLIRTLDLDNQANWLVVLAAHRVHTNPPAKLEVSIGGELAGSMEAPLLDPSHRDPAPLIVPLTPYRSVGARQVDVEIVATHAAQPLDWRTISVHNQMPLLATLLEDAGELENVTPELPQVGPVWETQDRHAGNASLKVMGGQSVRLTLAEPLKLRRDPKWGEYRDLRFAIRKKRGGRIRIELNGPAGEQRVARYQAGQGEPEENPTNRVWASELPDEWIVITRNVPNEFGEFDAHSLTIEVPDGDYALIDHIYLARNEGDFRFATPSLSPELVNQKARRELASKALERALPAVVKLEMSDGRTGTATMITPEGHLLTAGHLLVTSGQMAKVWLSDGREFQAKSLGVDRDIDVGLLKIEEGGPFPQLELLDARELPTDQMYVASAYQPLQDSTEEPRTHIVDVRRVLNGVVWTDFELSPHTAGGPLLDREGRLVGVHTARSGFGGFQYAIGASIRSSFDRMKQGEVWGQWAPGTGPMIGLVIRSTAGGCRVVKVLEESPADVAGLQVDDYLTHVADQPVATLSEVYELLRTKNPGEKVKIIYLRQGQPHAAEMTLTARWP